MEDEEENLNIVGNFELTDKKAFSSYNYAKQMRTNKIFAYRELSKEEKKYNDNIEKYKVFKNDYLMQFEKEKDLIFWECCNGGNLQFFIKYLNYKIFWPLEEILIQKIIKQIIEGLECLHKNSNNKIIGGLSLDNIFINFKGIKNEELLNNIIIRKNYDSYIKEGDIDSFNIKMRYFVSLEERDQAIKSGDNTREYETKYYLPREILKHEKNSNPISTNMWSLGVITYKLLTGNKKLFDGKSEEEIIQNIEKKEMEISSELTPSLQIINFITSLLKYNPDDRPKLQDIKNNDFLKLNPENFDFINIKLLAKGENRIILNLNKTYPINEYLLYTNLMDKVPKENLYKSQLKFIEDNVNNSNKNIEILKNEYNNLRNITSQVRDYYQEQIANLVKYNKDLLEKREKIMKIINDVH